MKFANYLRSNDIFHVRYIHEFYKRISDKSLIINFKLKGNWIAEFKMSNIIATQNFCQSTLHFEIYLHYAETSMIS